jgi:hypothetical protein
MPKRAKKLGKYLVRFVVLLLVFPCAKELDFLSGPKWLTDIYE